MKKLLCLAIISSIPVSTYASTEETRIPPSQGVFSWINPFWKVPEIDPQSTFEFRLDIPIKNEWNAPITPTGKVFLLDETGTPLSRIGVIQANATSSGKLVDYIPINEEEFSLPEGEEHVFSLVWRGFWEQYIQDGKPVITFQTPSTYYDHENYQIAFWEKLILSKETKAFTAKAQIHYIDPSTRVFIDKEEIIPLVVSYPVIIRAPNTGLLAILWILVLVWLFLLTRSNKHTEPLKTRTTHQTFADIEMMMEAELKKESWKKTRLRTQKKKQSSTPQEASSKTDHTLKNSNKNAQ